MKEIIEKTKGKKIPSRPEVTIPERTDIGILSQITHQVRDPDEKKSSKTSYFVKGSREKWKINEEKAMESMHQLLKNPDPPKVNESFIGSRIEYLSEFGLYDEME